MVNRKGLQSYCQECGACADRRQSAPAPSGMDRDLASVIAEEISRALGRPASAGSRYPEIPLGVSNRHIHLRQETFRALFGPSAALEVERELYQPGEFASKSTLLVVGPRMNPLKNVRILGPFRKYDQVELSFTDAVALGLRPPVRDSGDLAGSSAVTLVGPAGTVELREGAIAASRHIHMNPADAAVFGVKSGDSVKVRVQGQRSVVYEKILVRVGEGFRLQFHLDTDEANAAGTVCGSRIEFLGRTG